MQRFLAVSVAVTDDPFQKKQILRRLVEGGLQWCMYHFRISGLKVDRNLNLNMRSHPKQLRTKTRMISGGMEITV
jgi:hypothetical protein